MANYIINSASSTPPISLSEAKAQLKIEDSFTLDDDLITAIIEEARDYVEDDTTRKLLANEIEERFDSFENIKLSFLPVQSVASVQYLDENGNYQTLSDAIYDVFNGADKPTEICLAYDQSLPSYRPNKHAFKVTYTVGYDSVAAIPGRLIRAIKLLVAEWYENRENRMKKHPDAVDFLLSPYKQWHR